MSGLGFSLVPSGGLLVLVIFGKFGTTKCTLVCSTRNQMEVLLTGSHFYDPIMMCIVGLKRTMDLHRLDVNDCAKMTT